MRVRTTRLRSFCFVISRAPMNAPVSGLPSSAAPAGFRARSTPTREYAPLCLSVGLRWGKAEEVRRGWSPRESLRPNAPSAQLLVAARVPGPARPGEADPLAPDEVVHPV